MRQHRATQNIRQVVAERFGGVISAGDHTPDGAACALEARSVALGIPWTDRPALVGFPDIRPVNDGPWSSDEARTAGLLPVLEALWNWPDWSDERRTAWSQIVALRTVCEVLPVALRQVGMETEAVGCEGATDLGAARAAARAAAHAVAAVALAASDAAAYAAAKARRAVALAASDAAAYAARAAKARRAVALAASDAAAYAARAAKARRAVAGRTVDDEAADRVLGLACRIWVEAAAQTGK